MNLQSDLIYGNYLKEINRNTNVIYTELLYI